MTPPGTAPAPAPQVSVLIPVFNGADYIEQAVFSVLKQTLADFELIIVDDGSTDTTPAILESVARADPRIVIARRPHAGLGHSLNHGLALARAPYVAILDADDLMLPERLEVQAAHLDANPGLTAVGSQWFTIDSEGRLTGLDRHPTDPETVAVLMYAYFACHQPTLMVRRDALIAHGGYPTSRSYGGLDYELFSGLIAAGHRITNLPRVLSCWRLNPRGITHGKAAFQTQHCDAIRHRAFDTLAQQDPARAAEVALALVRAAPTGTWFDHKLATLLPDAGPSPARLHWRKLASGGQLPALEVAAVGWLEDEAGKATKLAAELDRAGMPWLAQLSLARAAQLTPESINNTLDSTGRYKVASASASSAAHLPPVALSILIPVQRTELADLPARLLSLLTDAPEQSEVVIFSVDGHALANLPGTVAEGASACIRTLPLASPPHAWREALAAARGQHLACITANVRPQPNWHRLALRHAAQSPRCVLVSPSQLSYADACAADGHPVPDPAPQPHWTQSTLLGRDHIHLADLVFPRQAVASLPLRLEELGDQTAWALARALLSLQPAPCLPLQGQATYPAVALSNEIMPTVIRRLLAWYLDSGLGAIPAPHTWAALDTQDASERLALLDHLALTGDVRIHPGNQHLVLGFVARFAPFPLRNRAFLIGLDADPPAAFNALKTARHPAHVHLAEAWRLGRRLGRRLHRMLLGPRQASTETR